MSKLANFVKDLEETISYQVYSARPRGGKCVDVAVPVSKVKAFENAWAKDDTKDPIKLAESFGGFEHS